MFTLVYKKIFFIFIFFLFFGINGSRTQAGILSVERVKYQVGGHYLVVEFLDDDLVHFELSALGPGPYLNQQLYTTPMVIKTNYTGPSSFTNDGNGILETPEIRVQVNPNNLCVTVTDKSKYPNLSLSTICPLNLDQPWKGITFTPESFTHAYGLGQ